MTEARGARGGLWPVVRDQSATESIFNRILSTAATCKPPGSKDHVFLIFP